MSFFKPDIKLSFCVVLAVAIFHAQTAECAEPCGTELQEIIYDQLFVIQRYNNRFRPPPGIPGIPTEVGVEMVILDFVMDCDTDQLTVNIVIRQRWNDGRLKYDYSTSDCPQHKYLMLTTLPDTVQIWQPDLVLFSQLSSFNHDTPDRRNHYIRLFPNGDVVTSYYMSITTPCILADKGSHTCELLPTMFGSTTEDVDLSWFGNNALFVDPDSMARNNKHAITEIQNTKDDLVTSTGTYAQLVVKILVRELASMSTSPSSSAYGSTSSSSSYVSPVSYNTPTVPTVSTYTSPSYTPVYSSY